MMPVPRDTKNRHKLPDNLDPAGTRCVPVFVPDDAEWIAMLYDALATLGTSQRYVWGDDAKTVANRWKTVLYQTSQYIGAGERCSDASQPDEGTCTTLSAHHPAVSYWPNNPVLQPDEPGPYSSRVWRVGNPINPFEQSGDSYIDPLAFLGIPLSEVFTIGLPYWHIAFEGSGEVDIGLIQVLQGGAMWVFPDGNPLAGDLVSLQYIDIEELAGVEALLSLLEILGQSDFQIVEAVHTVEFTTPGAHSLTGWMIPTVEPAPPFLGIGGGLRSIQLCGDITVIEDAVIPYTLDAQPDGTIRLLADGVPVSTLDLRTLLDDDYVNVEGDTMSGTLTMQPAALNANPFRVREPGGFLTLDSLLYSGGFQFLVPSTRSFVWGSGTMYQQMFRDYVTVEEGGVGAPRNGVVNIFSRTHVPLALGKRLSDVLDFTQYSDYLGTLKYAVAASGQVLTPGVLGRGYSSTATWRDQFALTGYFSEETDAIRQGAVALSVFDFDGEHDVIVIESDSGVSTGAKFGAFGSSPAARNTYAVAGRDAALDAIIDQLNAYGWLDMDVTAAPPETTGLTDAQRCNIATYMASNLADTIAQIFTNLSTLTLDEFLTGLIEDFDVQVGGIEQMLAQAQVNASYFDIINGDLDDEEAIRDALLDCDFDQACFFDWIDNTSPYNVHTKNIVKTLLALTWDTRVKFWTQVGKYIDGDACGDGTLPCADTVIDLRWGSAQGTLITVGSLQYDLGAVEGNPPGQPGLWGIFVDMRLDACPVDYMVCDVVSGSANQVFQIWMYEADGMGGWTQIATSGPQGLAPGAHNYAYDPNGSPVCDRIVVSFENEPGANPQGSVIQRIGYFV